MLGKKLWSQPNKQQMDKENVIHMDNAILFSNKEE
jgi:hypothetical protein